MLTDEEQKEGAADSTLGKKNAMTDAHELVAMHQKRTATYQVNIDGLQKTIKGFSEERATLDIQSEMFRKNGLTAKKGVDQYEAKIRVLRSGANNSTLEDVRTGCGFHDFPTLALMRKDHECGE